MADQNLPVIQEFISDLRAAFSESKDTETAMNKVRAHLEILVRDEDLRARSKDWPSTEGHKNLLLYEDPDYGFAINAVVRTPNRKGGIHDHAHAWTAYGLLDGTEKLERYSRLDDGTKEGYDLELTRAISDRVGIPVIASGGVGKLEHIYEGLTAGKASAALAASIFHYREYTISECKDYLHKKGIPVRLAHL